VQTENVTLKTMQAIAQVLHVKIDDLIKQSKDAPML
jgi:DNA-binding Xre family transcriptional regulator